MRGKNMIIITMNIKIIENIKLRKNFKINFNTIYY